MLNYLSILENLQLVEQDLHLSWLLLQMYGYCDRLDVIGGFSRVYFI